MEVGSRPRMKTMTSPVFCFTNSPTTIEANNIINHSPFFVYNDKKKYEKKHLWPKPGLNLVSKKLGF